MTLSFHRPRPRGATAARRPRGAATAAWLAAAVWLSCGTAAQARVDTEPNDTFDAAQRLGVPGGAFEVTGGRSFADPSDDFFRFRALSSGVLRIESTSSNAAADSVMGLFNGRGRLLASNDDAGGGSMSTIEFLLPRKGAYVLGFSGYNPALLSCAEGVTACYDTDGDFVFDTFVAGGGAGGSAGWDYTLRFTGASLVPEPPTALLFLPALALLQLVRARRSTARQNA